MSTIFIFILLLIIGYSITNNIIISTIVALIFTAVLESYLTNHENNMINKTNQSLVYEGMTSRRKKHKRRKLKKNKILDKKKFPKGKYTFDPKKSYRETYKNLSKRQVKGINKDTKNLVKTQERLLNTLKEMGPVLEQGKSIIGAFDSFFGDSGRNNDLAYMTKRLGIGKDKK